MMNVLKTVVLFIGTIVGAGLATGRELTVYLRIFAAYGESFRHYNRAFDGAVPFCWTERNVSAEP